MTAALEAERKVATGRSKTWRSSQRRRRSNHVGRLSKRRRRTGTPSTAFGQRVSALVRTVEPVTVSQRYYDPVIGRYISRDPIGLSAGPNVYAYCRNNPANLIDPLGLSDEDPKLQWHHKLSKDVFDDSLRKANPGIKDLDINSEKYGWVADEDAHKALHFPEGKHGAVKNPEGGLDGRQWNKDWKEWADSQKPGSITTESVEKQLAHMEKTYANVLKHGIHTRDLSVKLDYNTWGKKAGEFQNNLEALKGAVGEQAMAREGGQRMGRLGGAARVGGKIISKGLMVTAILFAVQDYAHGAEQGGVAGGAREVARGIVMAPEVEAAVRAGAEAVNSGIENSIGAPIKNYADRIREAAGEE